MWKTFETTQLYLEKKLILLCEMPSFSNLKNSSGINQNSSEILRSRKFSLSLKLPRTFFFENNNGIKVLNLPNLKNNNNLNFFSLEQQANSRSLNTEKQACSFTNSTNDENSHGKRRKRRNFTNDEERRIARILKNRRTAEESRQRRIQKMKDLENFAASLDQREKKLREENQFLGKQNASQAAELILLKEKLSKIRKSNLSF
ncbi:hypothetical protein HAN_2g257 (nucleomorph) [Hemiselmis andersenii]|uniref:BZIP domain-containing protein n=1 Tax=Hemiselmis andersenii TaxID=464988 RepID=A9BKS6_HEMAN|nr:hypothetical protein HAN_2g257 [Hemiselmis andersenii]ABW98081.1 hypothetical protein HAN_2g257 [Hemiselmis andersenii]|mmetsp:Transcript_10066/g.23549  ORF Transcript_10066/g.23549 Transcript_10066/m.23549 type:complete len:203 (+) Transcript_10066:48-656(+)